MYMGAEVGQRSVLGDLEFWPRNWSRGWGGGEVGQDCAEPGRQGLRKRFPRTGEGWPGSLAVGTGEPEGLACCKAT